MKNGNISNQSPHRIGFRVDNSLVIPNTYKTFGRIKYTVNKLKAFVKGTPLKGVIDENIESLIFRVFSMDKFCVDLIVHDDWLQGKIGSLTDHIPHSSIIIIRSENQITSMLNTRRLFYYVDSNEERVSKIGNINAMTPQQFKDTLII